MTTIKDKKVVIEEISQSADRMLTKVENKLGGSFDDPMFGYRLMDIFFTYTLGSEDSEVKKFNRLVKKLKPMVDANDKC